MAARNTRAQHWQREQVAGLDALARGHTLDTPGHAARAAVEEATTELDAAVTAARAVGESWNAAGEATGLARQSAHGRWGQPTTQRETD